MSIKVEVLCLRMFLLHSYANLAHISYCGFTAGNNSNKSHSWGKIFRHIQTSTTVASNGGEIWVETCTHYLDEVTGPNLKYIATSLVKGGSLFQRLKEWI